MTAPHELTNWALANLGDLSFFALGWLTFIAGFCVGVLMTGSRADRSKDRLVRMVEARDTQLRVWRAVASVEQSAEVQRRLKDLEVLSQYERELAKANQSFFRPFSPGRKK